MTSFKAGDLVVPTFSYWSLKSKEPYVVDAITKVTYSKARDFGQPRLRIQADTGRYMNYNPKNFVKVGTGVTNPVHVKDRYPVDGDRIYWKQNPSKVWTAVNTSEYGSFQVECNGNVYSRVYDARNPNNQIYHYIPENDMPAIIKTKSRYVIVDAATGFPVASSGEKDPHFNEWTDESLKEWLNDEVSTRLRASPGSKFDVYSFEMQGKLPAVSVDWSSK